MRTMVSSTLNRYLGRTFLLNFLFVLGLLLALIFMFDTLELLRRAGKQVNVPLHLVLEMSLFKLPEVTQILLPFAVLFAAMFTFWRLNRRSEIAVMRASGYSVWQFLAPIMGVAAAICVFYLAFVNPIGAMMLGRYEALENELIFHRTSSVAVLREGLWMRQDLQDGGADAVGKDGGHIILHAERIDQPSWVMHDVMALYFGPDDAFIQRVDAPVARLAKGRWLLDQAIVFRPHQPPQPANGLALPPDISTEQIEDSLSEPGAISFWQMPGFIATMEQTGFDAVSLKVRFQALLAQPLSFAAMILLAAIVSLRPPRQRGVFLMALGGVIGGFMLFFSSSFMQALGSSHQIPPVAAAWAAPLVAALLGLAVLLNYEDG